MSRTPKPSKSPVDFEVVDPEEFVGVDDDHHLQQQTTQEQVAAVQQQQSQTARMVGRRIDILVASVWRRGTILEFSPERDAHLVIHDDGPQERTYYKLGEVLFKIVEVEEEWVVTHRAGEGGDSDYDDDDDDGEDEDSLTDGSME